MRLLVVVVVFLLRNPLLIFFWLTFYYLNDVFKIIQVSNFHKTHYSFDFNTCTFVAKKVMPCRLHKYLPLCLPDFTALTYFNLKIHFELSFFFFNVLVRKGIPLHSVDISCPSIICWKDFFSR